MRGCWLVCPSPYLRTKTIVLNDDDLKRKVLDALSALTDPGTGRNIVEAGMVSGLVVRGGAVGFALDVPAARARSYEPLRTAAENAVARLPGVTRASVVLTAERAVAPPKVDGHAEIRRIIAVASGKGGVGKSTVATNLALALGQQGLKVGLLDADIYGPSTPRMLGLSGKPDTHGGKLLPKDAFGLKAMSIGLIVPDEQAMIWRGPMATGALMQLVSEVAWGPLDVLIVDMPPGTGDIQLTLSQRVPLFGAVIVSTPQDIALIDARKAIAMFGKVNVPILGLVENMSVFVCPHCATPSHIFGHGGARRMAEQLGAPFLGEIPLELSVRETSDSGTPIVASAPLSASAGAFQSAARALRACMDGTAPPPTPVLRFVD